MTLQAGAAAGAIIGYTAGGLIEQGLLDARDWASKEWVTFRNDFSEHLRTAEKAIAKEWQNFKDSLSDAEKKARGFFEDPAGTIGGVLGDIF